jgi:hypothetical protein
LSVSPFTSVGHTARCEDTIHSSHLFVSFRRRAVGSSPHTVLYCIFIQIFRRGSEFVALSPARCNVKHNALCSLRQRN